jgi:hypothetical protein
VAFLRFSRDKRGYEHFYLVEPVGRREKSQTKILYWFRTPPGIKVGREPFDAQIRRALEEQNPRVSFDWKKLVATPIPPPSPDVEHWRERRKAERAPKQAAREEAAAEAAAAEAAVAEAAVHAATEAAALASQDERPREDVPAAEAESQTQTAQAVDQPPSAGQGRRRGRRRRRGARRSDGGKRSVGLG